MDVEDDIRRAVEADARSQLDIARAAGIHPVTLNRFQNREREITDIRTLRKLAKAVGVEIVAKPKRKRAK